jgi:hypothetical protein
VVGPGAFSKYFRRYGYCSCWTKGDENCARKNARLRDANGQALSHIYYESEPGRRSAAKWLSKDEARRIAVNIAKGGGSKPGERRGGRQKGTPNKLTKDVKEAILGAAEEIGGPEGMKGYFKQLAVTDSSVMFRSSWSKRPATAG